MSTNNLGFHGEIRKKKKTVILIYSSAPDRAFFIRKILWIPSLIKLHGYPSYLNCELWSAVKVSAHVQMYVLVWDISILQAGTSEFTWQV